MRRTGQLQGGENAQELMLTQRDVAAFLDHEDKTAAALNTAIITELSARVDSQAKMIRRQRARIAVLVLLASFSMFTRWIARKLLPRPRA